MTPKELGYAMPPEWAPQRAVWLIWPSDPEQWPVPLEPVWEEFSRLIAELTHGQLCEVLVPNSKVAERVQDWIVRMEGDLSAVGFHVIPTNDCWARDCGPTFLLRRFEGRKKLAAVAWEFNAYSGKFPPWDLDAAVATAIAERLEIPRFAPGIVLEGGAIEVNGHGIVMTTEQCLLQSGRNPELDRVGLEQVLHDYLGTEQVLWLAAGLDGDHTDGHVDDIARFVDRQTVVAAREPNEFDPNHDILEENWRRLHAFRDHQGNPLKLVALPMPPLLELDGERLAATYANFLITNDLVLVPSFGCPQDLEAIAILSELFPGRRVVGLSARELIKGGGSLHCLTQQEPAA